MIFSNKLPAFHLLKNDEAGQFDYPEIFVLLITITLIIYHFDFNPASIALFIVVSIPSVMTLIYSYYRQANFWTANIIILLVSIVIGSMQFCIIISLSLGLWVGVRIIANEPENRLQLIAVSIISATVFYYVSLILNGGKIDCHGGFLTQVILLASVVAMLWQFWVVYHHYMDYEKKSQVASGRLIVMVSVINKLTRFIPSQIWKPIVNSNSPVTVTNKRAKLSIMFSDIVGFTELSETLSADNLADILNTYIHCMTVIADKHNAVIDKFIGDGMVCFFGDPNSQGFRQDALACVAMAIDMRREMRSLRHKWRLMGFEGLDVRIGINTDYCHVGNFGSNHRLSYTLIGKAANLAARLESVAGKGEIFISERTHDYVYHDYQCEFSGDFQLKGFNEKVSAWQVLDPDINQRQLSKWVDYTLPGFNLHLNFKDMHNYDYKVIKKQLNLALEHLEGEERNQKSKLERSEIELKDD